jgi:hypothetical protein
LDVAPVGSITEDEWRACWPVDGAEPEPGESLESDSDEA